MSEKIALWHEFHNRGQYVLVRKEAAKHMFKQFPTWNPRYVARCFVDESVSINDWEDWLLDAYFEARKEILEASHG